MAEEARFFLRIAIYSTGISIVYWFLSYEIAGSLLLLILGLSAAFFVVTLLVLAHVGYKEDGNIFTRAKQAIGFEDHPAEDKGGPVVLEEAPIAPTSAWPLVAALATLLVGLGILYGGWMWIPGAALGMAALWGWITQLYP